MASAFGSASALALAEGKRNPLVFSIEVNNRCNLSCDSCFISPAFGYGSKDTEIPLEALEERIRDTLTALSRYDIILTFAGKEPLFDYARLAHAYAASSGRVAGIAAVTNGDIGLVHHNLDILKELDGIDISLNGGTEADNALTRGANSFGRALEGIAILQECGVDIGISYLVMEKNKGAINSFHKALEATGVRRVSYSLARRTDGELVFGDEDGIDLLTRAIEQTPDGVKVLVEATREKYMLALAQRLHGVYVQGDGANYNLPQIIGTPWELLAVTNDTGPIHVRLLHDGKYLFGKDMFRQKKQEPTETVEQFL